MPESSGKILKRIRESKHLSIEEVCERSRIPKNIVSLIEEDRLGEIKSGFYAKSFVKTYAGFLGALGEPAVKEYIKNPAREEQKKPEVSLKPKAGHPETPRIDFSFIGRFKRQIAAIAAVVFILWALSWAVGRIGALIKNIPAKKQSKPAKAAQVQKSVSVKPDFVEIEVSASDNTWLRVIGDNEIMFTGLFKKGSRDTWKARKEIRLEVGNSGAVKINISGKPSGFSGKKGEKKEIRITKDGIK